MGSKSVAICRDYLSCRTLPTRPIGHRTVTRSALAVTGFWYFERVENGAWLVGGRSKLLGEFESLLAAG